LLKKLSFRQKIFFSQLFVFFFFILLLFPFGQHTVHEMVRHALTESSKDLIQKLQKQPNELAMISYLKSQELFVFFRASIINDQCELVYDTHLTKQIEEHLLYLTPAAHPEVVEAFRDGVGYEEAWSQAFDRRFAYSAVRFDFEGKQYVLRTALPLSQMNIFVRNFQIGLFTLDTLFFIFFSFTTWFIFTRLSRPIHEIINAVQPYQEGKEVNIPEIHLQDPSDDEFSHLASTLNSLSSKIRSHIRSILEERNEKEAILESLVEGVIAVDASNIVRYANFTGSKMLGKPKRQLIGKLLPDEKEGPRAELLRKCASLLRICQEHDTIITDSIAVEDVQKVYLDLIAAPKPLRSGAIIVLQDKSSHHKVIEMGKDFVANASHELRTPITVIRGFAETLQDLPDITPDMLANITEKIVRSCQRMDTLVKNLLLLADIENVPETRFQECDIPSLVESCRHMVCTVYPDAEIEIVKIGDKLLARADPDLFELAVMNLLDNAAKYSNPPAKIKVTVSEKEDEIEIQIQDKGIGIPEKDLDHIFDRFYTVDKARSRKLGGAGLGLSIVRTIVEKHDGTIAVVSTVGVGTAFTILLPKRRQYHTEV